MSIPNRRSEASQAWRTYCGDVSMRRAAGASGVADDAELGREHHPLPPALEETPEQLLVVPQTVHVRRVQKIDALLERGRQRLERLLIIAGPVKFRHAHAAEADGGDSGSGLAQRTSQHGRPLLIVSR